jgi:hypothetical protein
MMEPMTLIQTALMVGASAALQKTAGQAVEDAYQAFKQLLFSRFQATKAAVEVLESDPQDEDSQRVAKKQLQKADDGQKLTSDLELLERAQAVLKAIQKHAPQLAGAVGVSLKDIEAGASLTIRDIVSSGSGVVAEGVTAQQDITIEGVRAGQQGRADPN